MNSKPPVNKPLVGIAVLVRRNGKTLVGVRLSENGYGSYAFPGGGLEFGESWERCGEREVYEETGMIVQVVPYKDQPYLFVTNNIMDGGKRHYITIWLLADWVSGEPENREPSKCEGWQWLTIKDLKNLIPLDGDHRQWMPVELLEPLDLGV